MLVTNLPKVSAIEPGAIRSMKDDGPVPKVCRIRGTGR